MTLLEIVETYGPILAADSELGIIIQANGSYLNCGVEGSDGWGHTDCRSTSGKPYCERTFRARWDLADEWLEEIRNPVDDDDDEASG